MTASRDPDRLIHAFLREGEDELHDQVYDAIRAGIEQKRQRAFLGPWGLPEMHKIVTIGFGAAAVVIAIFVSGQLLGSPSGGLGNVPTQTPETSVTEPTATPETSPSPASAPSLTQSFTSTLHGISVAYPDGWTARAASEPWTDSTFALNFLLTHADFLFDPTLEDNLFLTISSQPIGDSTPENWVAEQMASEEGCTATQAVAVDGATGLIGEGECHVAVVTTAGRGYWIQLYASGDELSAYDLAWFEDVLATVELHPEDAVDSVPSPSP